MKYKKVWTNNDVKYPGKKIFVGDINANWEGKKIQQKTEHISKELLLLR